MANCLFDTSPGVLTFRGYCPAATLRTCAQAAVDVRHDRCHGFHLPCRTPEPAMKAAPDDAHWAAYNAGQHDRDIRPLCREILDRAGPGAGRCAVDLGCGAGRETRALLDAGWRVHAFDGEPGVRAALADVDNGRLTIEVIHFADLTSLPPADLVHAGYSLPYQTPEQFNRLWTRIRSSVRPGGWLAVDLFGERDSWAGADAMTFLSARAARELFDGLEVVSWVELDEDGPAYGGPKHWHVFQVIARRL
jgi:SAM-dependent methyltransferase